MHTGLHWSFVPTPYRNEYCTDRCSTFTDTRHIDLEESHLNAAAGATTAAAAEPRAPVAPNYVLDDAALKAALEKGGQEGTAGTTPLITGGLRLGHAYEFIRATRKAAMACGGPSPACPSVGTVLNTSQLFFWVATLFRCSYFS